MNSVPMSNVLMNKPAPTPDEILQFHFTDRVVISEEDLKNIKDVIKLRFYQTKRPLLPPDLFELPQQALAVVENIFQKNYELAREEVHRIHPPPPANGGLALPPGAGALLVPEGTRR